MNEFFEIARTIKPKEWLEGIAFFAMLGIFCIGLVAIAL